MSNFLAIASITAALKRTLQMHIEQDVQGTRVTTRRPNEIDISAAGGKGGVNLFLYHVITNPALNNIDAAPIRARSTSLKRQAALDLHYILNFYGPEETLEPQRLLGSAIRTLNDKRIITAEMIEEACNQIGVLSTSNLHRQIQQINVIPLDLSIEDLSKTWAIFFQSPYLLSVAYKVMVVIVEGDEVMPKSLPIRESRLHTDRDLQQEEKDLYLQGVPEDEQKEPKPDRQFFRAAPYFQIPHIDSIQPKNCETHQAIVLGSTLQIKGKNLKANPAIGTYATSIYINDTKHEIDKDPIENRNKLGEVNNEITLELKREHTPRAGIHTLKIIHSLDSSDNRNSSNRHGLESNTLPFMLSPIIEETRLLEGSEDYNKLILGELEITLNMEIFPNQKIILFLNSVELDPSQAYAFETSIEQESKNIIFKIQSVTSGKYLARIMIDGAESPLNFNDDLKSGEYEKYIEPAIEIKV
ncbi:DUF4255 domain-containing protein [filamentous cyanobacterium LEGE 11480]|uniref:DUF4255 domain-containing protein n=1 Tax=Romeriopsis navalis LEGE 11480 TaxID=2777977 RepID=A0A928Z478_9CYAN|nr:DUF4255 domain-containing protein [Romeriopsis navalis]MBE9031474.1 DUF4255 domain-containing protein [Romeriopsis navalis LEGE 11480]